MKASKGGTGGGGGWSTPVGKSDKPKVEKHEWVQYERPFITSAGQKHNNALDVAGDKTTGRARSRSVGWANLTTDEVAGRRHIHMGPGSLASTWHNPTSGTTGSLNDESGRTKQAGTSVRKKVGASPDPFV